MTSTRLCRALLALVFIGGCGNDPFDSGAASLSASTRGGMGAVPYGGGVTFRVWAPGANRLWVAGDFSGWQPEEMGNEFNGNFSIDHAGAHPGDRYKFQIMHGADVFWRVDPRAQEVEHSAGDGIVHARNGHAWQHDLDFHMPAWNEQVIYELHVGSFHTTRGTSGTWESARQKLDHLAWLGIDVIELMPATSFPGDFSWGYNPSNPFAPARQYGSADDMKRFVDEAHARGIAVVLDVTYNHFGPTDLPLWDFDGDSFGSGGIYFYNDWRGVTAWGNTRPNYGRREVRDFIRDNALQWVNEYHLDGVRVDSTPAMYEVGSGIPEGWSMMQEVTEAVHQSSPWKLMIAEDMHDNAAITRAVNGGGAGFDVQWDPAFVHPMQSVLTQIDDRHRSMRAVADALYHNYDGDGMKRVIYTESHDETANGKQRVPQMIDPGDPGSWYARKRFMLGGAMVLTAPGRPMIFQGQEMVTRGWFRAEEPLDWNFADAFSGVVGYYRDLIHLRRNWNDETRGLRGRHLNVFHVNDSDKVIAFHRWENGGARDDVVVVANFSSRTFYNYRVGLPRGGLWKLRFNGDWNGYSPDFANTTTFDTGGGHGFDGLPASGSINAIGAYSVLVYSQDQ